MMASSSFLLEVKENCVIVSTAQKVKERMEAFGQLMTLLTIEKVNLQIDHNTVADINQINPDAALGLLTWDKVVKSVLSMISNELQHALTVKRKKALSVRKETVGALRSVVKLAEQRGPRLFRCAKDIALHVKEVLCAPQLSFTTFSAEYSHLLCEYLLVVPAYCYLFGSSFWRAIVERYSTALLGDKTQTDKALYAKTFHCLVSHYPTELNSLFTTVQPFFIEYLGTPTKDSKALVYVISALNWFLQSCAVDMGQSVREIGKQLYHSFTHRLKQTRDDQMKDQLIFFFRLQLHLNKTFTGEVLAMDESQAEYTEEYDRLCALFEAIQQIMERSTGQFTLSSTTRMRQALRSKNEDNPLFLEPRSKSFLQLAADVLVQLSHYQTLLSSSLNQSLDSMSSGSSSSKHESAAKLEQAWKQDSFGKRKELSGSLGLASASNKKRRFMNVYEMLCNSLSISGASSSFQGGIASEAAVPSENLSSQSNSLLLWLQLFHNLIQAHPNWLPTKHYSHCIDLLSQILAYREVTERPELESWAVRCLYSLARISNGVPVDRISSASTSTALSFAAGSAVPLLGSDDEDAEHSASAQSSGKRDSISSSSASLTKKDSQQEILERVQLARRWQAIWNLILGKLVFYSHTNTELALSLLKAIIANELLDAKVIAQSQNALWKLNLFQDKSRCTKAALKFLITFIRKHEIRDEMNTFTGVPTDSKDRRHLSRREKLLEWIMTSLSDFSGQFQSSSQQSLLNSSPAITRKHTTFQNPSTDHHNLVATALLALIRSGPPKKVSSCDRNQEARKTDDPFFDSLLKNSFLYTIVDRYPGEEIRLSTHSFLETQLEVMELRLQEISSSRTLARYNNKCASVAKSHLGKNQIPLSSTVRLQNKCLDFLHSRTRELLRVGESLLVYSSRKRKTLGVEKNRLEALLLEMLSHCRTILSLFAAVFQSNDSPAPTFDHNAHEEAPEKLYSLIQFDFTKMLAFVSEHARHLAAQVEKLRRILLGIQDIALSYLPLHYVMLYIHHGKQKLGVKKGKEKLELDSVEAMALEEEEEEEESEATPEATFSSPFAPIINFVLQYLRNYIASSPSRRNHNPHTYFLPPQGSHVASHQLGPSTTSVSTDITNDLDLMEMPSPPTKDHEAGLHARNPEHETEPMDDVASKDSKNVPVPAWPTTGFCDECIFLCCFIAGTIASKEKNGQRTTEQVQHARDDHNLVDESERVASVLRDVLRVSSNVNIKFEIFHHLSLLSFLEYTTPIEPQPEPNAPFSSSPTQTSIEIAKATAASANLQLVRTILEGTNELLVVPEISGTELARKGILRILQAVASFVDEKQNLLMLHMQPPRAEDKPAREDEIHLKQLQEDNCKEREYLLKICVAQLNIFDQLWKSKQLHWSTRITFAKCVRAFLPVDISWVAFMDGEDKLFVEEWFSVLPEIFLKLLSDPNYRLRKYMSSAITIFFDLFSDQRQIYHDISRLLLPIPSDQDKSEEEKVTALLTLGEIACVPSVNEEKILLELCKLASKTAATEHGGYTTRMQSLISFVIDSMASRLGYLSSKAFVEDHLSFLLGQWVSKKLKLQSFPIDLCGSVNLVEFLKQYVGLLLPKLVFLMDKDNMLFVASLLCRDTADTTGHNADKESSAEYLQTLVKEHFAAIFAHTFPLYYAKGKRACKTDSHEKADHEEESYKDLGVRICEQFMEEFVSPEQMNALIPVRLDDIIIHLLDLIRWPEPHGSARGQEEGLQENGESAAGAHGQNFYIRPPLYSEKTISAVFDHLANGYKLTAVELFFKTADRVQKILLHLNEQLAYSHRSNEKKRIFGELQYVIQLLGAEICRPSILRDVIHTLLRVLSSELLSELHIDACKLLRNTLALALGHSPSWLTGHLKGIVTALIHLVHSSPTSVPDSISMKRSRDIKAKLKQEVLSTLSFLISAPQDSEGLLKEGEGDELSDAIRALDPFPETRAFAPLNIIYYKLRGNTDLVEEIARFLNVWKGSTTGNKMNATSSLSSQTLPYTPSSSPSLNHGSVVSPSSVSVPTKLAALSHLKKQLKNSEATLNYLLKEAQATPRMYTLSQAVGNGPEILSNRSLGYQGEGAILAETYELDNRNLIARLIWELVQLCAPQSDDTVRQMAGECLGELGAVDPYAISFSFAGQNDRHGHDTQAKEPVYNEEQFHNAKVRILEYLNSYLTDADVSVVRTASFCLKSILATGSGKAAWEVLPTYIKAELEPYRSSKALKDVPLFPDPLPEVSLSSEDLWFLTNQNYDRWVCRLTYSLTATVARDRVFRLCGPMCLKKPEFAEFLFPYLLLHIVFHDSASSSSSSSNSSSGKESAAKASSREQYNLYLSERIRKYLLSEDNHNVQSMQLILGSLNFLRKQFIFYSEAAEGAKTYSGNQRSSRSRSKAASRAVINERQPFWKNSFWKDFTFLEIARAAQRCSAYLTSLLYVELWCERKFGSLELSSPDDDTGNEQTIYDNEQGSVPLHQQLLLEIYCNINEPDGIYGLQRDHSIHSRIRTYEHERLWDKTVGAYDMMLQHLSPNASNSQLHLALSQGLISSLEHLGHHHLAELHLAGFATKYPHAFPALSEFQYESAWRSCKWQLDPWVKQSMVSFSDDTLSSASTSPISGEAANSHVASLLWNAASVQEKSAHFHMGAYNCLKALNDGDRTAFWKNLKKTRLELVKTIGSTSLESTKSVYPVLAKLQFLSEIENAWFLRWQPDAGIQLTQQPVSPSGIAELSQLEHTDGGSAISTFRLGPQMFSPSIPADGAVVPSGGLHKVLDHRSSGGLPQRTVPSVSQIQSLTDGWKERLSLMHNSFDLIEPLLTLGGVLLKILEREEYLPKHFIAFAALARSSNCFQVASNAIYQLKQNQKQGSLDLSWKLEEAKILWAQGEPDKALSVGKTLLKALAQQNEGCGEEGSSNDQRRLYADVIYCTGKWLAKTRSENSSTIIEEYLQKAVALYNQCGGNVCKAYFTLARYADSLYTHLAEKIRSSEWANSQKLRQHKERELKQCLALAKTRPNDKELKRHIILLERQCDIDKQENKRLETDRDMLLHNAVDNYLQCVITGDIDVYDVRVMFRLCSLWFNNSQDLHINKLIGKAVETSDLNSKKFLPLIYQIASRISVAASGKESMGGNSVVATAASSSRRSSGRGSTRRKKSRGKASIVVISDEEEEEEANENDEVKYTFQNVVNTVLETTATYYPHHVLWQIFAMSHGDKVQASRGKGRYVVDEDKVNAAKQLLHRLRQTKHKQLIESMSALIDAYIELAFLDVSKDKHVTTPLALSTSIKRIREMSDVPIPTMSVPVQPDGDYDSIPHVRKFVPTFTLAGGLNLPKIVECIGSDGYFYKQLVKGNDDLRQDQVMQQMFHMVNTLLNQNMETHRRRLRVRTYKVIPLTPCAGILEWVQNTIPLGQYLIGSIKTPYHCAHVKYRPNDMLSKDARKELSQATGRDKRRVFDSIMNRFKPVFHHFFLDKYPEPALWFEKRLNYVRSVATSSIVGYVVGLGDRHSQNILIDESTAEVVHIDLGVAFEQGKTLRTPEVVPFRLTRDIVDGMGVTGCEGVFRRCSEETMKVLRASHEFLLTIVEVFIHDPLFKWALSPIRALQLQRGLLEDIEGAAEDAANKDENLSDSPSGGVAGDAGASTSSSTSGGGGGATAGKRGNKEAERALLRLKAKLQGYEYGEALSVEGQVKQLIAEARDPNRLCEMFPGWAPWL
ncbi:non-specific serine/threonine protein kinase [Balamuthia mandrillaris]